ncbi:MAG: CRISPR-associated protein Cas5 [Gemmiger sp.]|nr:CRISPR-associated protein Cas5 [Gemmiger sp.]
MEIAGATAIWSRPDTGDAPVSYPAPTASAVRGIFEAVLWGPDIRVVPTAVEICAPIQYHAYVTNYGGPLRASKAIQKGNNYQLYATVLLDVCYRLYADVIPNCCKQNLPEKALEWDKKTTAPGHAYQDIFNRRLKRGQSFSIPVLGWKEFTPSYFGPFRPETEVCREVSDITIPSMLKEVFPDGYHSEYRAVYCQSLRIHQGRLDFSTGGAIDD